MIFLASNGFSLLELGLLEGLLHVVSFLGEIPTGAVADLKGRIVSRKLGRILYVLATCCVMTAHSFFVVAIGFVLYALSYNLESGAGEAFIYDTLAELKQTYLFKKVKARIEFLYQFANILGLLIGGYLALYSYTLLFSLEALLTIGALYLAMVQTEPFFEKKHISENLLDSLVKKTIRSLKEQTNSALTTIKEKPILSLLIVQSAFIITVTITLFYCLQIYWKSQGLTEFEIGIIFALGASAAALSALLTPALELRFGKERLVTILTPLLICLLFCLSFEVLTPLAFILTGALEGVLVVVVQDWINAEIPSSERATILSVQSMCFSLFMIILFPLTGLLATYVDMTFAFMILTLITVLFTGCFFNRWKQEAVKSV